MVDSKKTQRGVALFLSIFALFLLTGIAAALLMMATSESSINSNYRSEQVAYFAAKAGVEEARARVMTADPNSISGLLATVAPTTLNRGVIYIVDSSSGAKPWVKDDTYADSELCHDGYAGLGYDGVTLAVTAPNIRCLIPNGPNKGNAILPSGSTWYAISPITNLPPTSTLPFAGTSAAVPYKWTRIAPKLNSSVTYLTGSGNSVSTSTYYVNSGFAAADPI